MIWAPGFPLNSSVLICAGYLEYLISICNRYLKSEAVHIKPDILETESSPCRTTKEAEPQLWARLKQKRITTDLSAQHYASAKQRGSLNQSSPWLGWSLSPLTFYVLSLAHFFSTIEKCLLKFNVQQICILFSPVEDTFKARFYQCKFAIQNVIIDVRKYVLSTKLSTDHG